MVKKTYDVRGLIVFIMNFMDYFFTETHYRIYENPKHSDYGSPDGGYRVGTKSKGDNRRKRINWLVQFINPSRDEIEEYITTWVDRSDISGIPSDQDEWNETILNIFDDFVQKFLVVEKPNLDMGGEFILGYRQTNDRYENRVNCFMKYVQPTRSDIKKIIDQWYSSTH